MRFKKISTELDEVIVNLNNSLIRHSQLDVNNLPTTDPVRGLEGLVEFASKGQIGSCGADDANVINSRSGYNLEIISKRVAHPNKERHDSS